MLHNQQGYMYVVQEKNGASHLVSNPYISHHGYMPGGLSLNPPRTYGAANFNLRRTSTASSCFDER